MNPWLRRIFSLVVWAYPRDFRDEYGASISDHFEAMQADRAYAFRSLFEMLVTSIAMRAENLWRDLVYAVRMNVKAPLFTLVILSAIALSIATNTVSFALLDSVLLKPLPFADSARLGLIWQHSPQSIGKAFTSLSTAQVKSVSAGTTAFSSVTAALAQDTVTPPHGAPLQRIQVMKNYFSTLGVHPTLGSLFTSTSSEHEAVISSTVWQQRFGGDEHVVGRRLTLEGTSYTIVGVAPAQMLDPIFISLVHSDVWTPLPRVRAGDFLVVFPIVRLRDGVSWQAAQADLSRLQRNARGEAAPLPGTTYYTGPLDQSIFAGARSFFWLVFAAVTGVLLIACANVANLLLARGAVRENEFAVRSALGASRQRIASQVFIETLLLAILGAGIGLLLAWIALPWAKSNIPGGFPRLSSARIDSSVLSYVLALIVGVTVLTGMIPAYSRTARSKADAAARIRPLLVIAQIAIAFALAAAFGVVLRSFVTMTSVPLGFSPRNVYVASVHPSHNVMFAPTFAPPHPKTLQEVVRSIEAIPGVQDAAVATSVPFENAFQMQLMFPRGVSGTGKPSQPISAAQVGAGYFGLLRIPLVAGQDFKAIDFTSNTRNIAVNQSFVRTYFPNKNVLGKTIGEPPDDYYHIIAVIGDTRTSLKDGARPQIYFPYNGGFGPYYGLAIRVRHPVPGLARDVSAIMQRAQHVGSADVSVGSLEDFVHNDAAGMRTSLDLLGALAVVALLLGLAGIYSVVAYSTERRFHEIGIRMAVGARPGDVVLLIIGGALLQGLAGIAVGIVLSAFAAKLLESELYKTSPLDPATLLAVMLLLIACALSAALIPAFRAALARPSATLRYE